MPSAYPTALDTLPTDKTDDTVSVGVHAPLHNDLADAINKIEAELGTDPSGALATVKEALATKQSLDSDLTAIAALTTTAFGRSLLEQLGPPQAKALLGVEPGFTPLYVPGYWTSPLSATGTGAPVLNRLYFLPMIVDKARLFSKMGAYVVTGAVNAVFRFGMYAYSPSTGLPGALLDDFGTADASGPGGDKTVIVNKEYGPGWIALAAAAQVAAPANVYLCGATIGGLLPGSNTVALSPGLYLDGVTGPLPASGSAAGLLNTFSAMRASLMPAP